MSRELPFPTPIENAYSHCEQHPYRFMGWVFEDFRPEKNEAALCCFRVLPNPEAPERVYLYNGYNPSSELSRRLAAATIIAMWYSNAIGYNIRHSRFSKHLTYALLDYADSLGL